MTKPIKSIKANYDRLSAQTFGVVRELQLPRYNIFDSNQNYRIYVEYSPY